MAKHSVLNQLENIRAQLEEEYELSKKSAKAASKGQGLWRHSRRQAAHDNRAHGYLAALRGGSAAERGKVHAMSRTSKDNAVKDAVAAYKKNKDYEQQAKDAKKREREAIKQNKTVKMSRSEVAAIRKTAKK